MNVLVTYVFVMDRVIVIAMKGVVSIAIMEVLQPTAPGWRVFRYETFRDLNSMREKQRQTNQDKTTPGMEPESKAHHWRFDNFSINKRPVGKPKRRTIVRAHDSRKGRYKVQRNGKYHRYDGAVLRTRGSVILRT